jgi:hypothetical protein
MNLGWLGYELTKARAKSNLFAILMVFQSQSTYEMAHHGGWLTTLGWTLLFAF